VTFSGIQFNQKYVLDCFTTISSTTCNLSSGSYSST